MTNLVVLYGPPGSGKSTLAHHLSTLGFSYFNLAKHPEFGKRAMADLAAANYHEASGGAGLVVEGVLARREVRTRFVREVVKGCEDAGARPFKQIAVFLLMESAHVLATRRRRSVEEYSSLLTAVEQGNPPYPHFTLNGQELLTTEERAVEVLRAIDGLHGNAGATTND